MVPSQSLHCTGFITHPHYESLHLRLVHCDPFPTNALDNNNLAWNSPSSLEMSSVGKCVKEEDWEALFWEETPEHIRDSIPSMDVDIYGEFKLRLGPELTISNY